jgi:hypothetical protein
MSAASAASAAAAAAAPAAAAAVAVSTGDDSEDLPRAPKKPRLQTREQWSKEVIEKSIKTFMSESDHDSHEVVLLMEFVWGVDVMYDLTKISGAIIRHVDPDFVVDAIKCIVDHADDASVYLEAFKEGVIRRSELGEEDLNTLADLLLSSIDPVVSHKYDIFKWILDHECSRMPKQTKVDKHKEIRMILDLPSGSRVAGAILQPVASRK